MITKQQYEQSLLHEVKVIKHLATKILPGTLDYRPTEKQRSMLELMQYLSHIGGTLLELIIAENRAIFSTSREYAAETTAENFAQRMDAQAQKIQQLLASMNDADITKEFDIWGSGQTQPKGVLLVDNVLKNMAAYRMQFFLYIKASGRHDIGTADAWRGEDTKPQE